MVYVDVHWQVSIIPPLSKSIKIWISLCGRSQLDVFWKLSRPISIVLHVTSKNKKTMGQFSWGQYVKNPFSFWGTITRPSWKRRLWWLLLLHWQHKKVPISNGSGRLRCWEPRHTYRPGKYLNARAEEIKNKRIVVVNRALQKGFVIFCGPFDMIAFYRELSPPFLYHTARWKSHAMFHRHWCASQNRCV